jgi:hypothetical protein
LKIFPPSDGLIEVWSAHALTGPSVRHISDPDLHAWNPTAQYLEPTSYLYPAQTYERYLRNALRDPDARPIGMENPPTSQATFPRNITPMNMDPLRAGETITRAITLDANRAVRFFARWDRGDVNVELRAPDGTRYTSANYREATYLKADIASFVGYAITRAPSGVWQIIASRADKGQDALKLTTYADLDSDLKMNSSTNLFWYRPGETISLGTSLTNGTTPVSEADVRASIQWLGIGVSPRGEAIQVVLHEKDQKVAPGNYWETVLTPDRGGYYLVRVTARGAGIDRERELIFSVSPETARFEGTPRVRVEGSPGKYTALVIEADVNASRAGDFAIAATLKSARGEVVAGLTSPIGLKTGGQTASVSVPGRDIRASGVDGPYTVDLILMDASWAAAQTDVLDKILTINEYRANDFVE